MWPVALMGCTRSKKATRRPPLELIEQLIERYVLDVLATAGAVQGKPMSDHLDDFGARPLSELVGGFTAGEQTAVLNAALDELVRLESFFGLFGDSVGDIGFSDKDDGIEVVGEGAKLTNLLAGECHVSTRFLRERFLQVNDTAHRLIRQAFACKGRVGRDCGAIENDRMIGPRGWFLGLACGNLVASYVSTCSGAQVGKRAR